MKSQAQLLGELRTYIDEYVQYLDHCTEEESRAVDADLQQIIAELEALLTHPNQQADAERLARRIRAQLTHLQRSNQTPQRTHPLPPSASKRTLRQAFQDYITEEIQYIGAAAGATRREQINALLSDSIADLKALALHPTDAQARLLTADLDAKRDQLRRLAHPWQIMDEPQAR